MACQHIVDTAQCWAANKADANAANHHERCCREKDSKIWEMLQADCLPSVHYAMPHAAGCRCYIQTVFKDA